MARPDKKSGKNESTKKKRGAKRPQKKWTNYEIKGDTIVRKNKSCPKCGLGVYLANHKERLSCGKCGYTEFLKKA